MAHHLAQLNIAAARGPLDGPVMAEFMAALDEVNALAEAAPGYVWRLQDDGGNATSIHAYDDPNMLLNLTVWESVESLKAFAYRGLHGEFFKRRAAWFRPEGRGVVMWWVPAGHLPTVDEANERLDFLRAHGPSPFAFTFATASGAGSAPLDIDRTELDDAVAQTLIGELNDELRAMYPEPGSNFFRLDAAEVAPGRGGFLVARLSGDPVGCGAFRRLDDETVELKRMYVRAAGRGQKVGAALLSRLETAARAIGVRRAVLETGARQEAALGLYEQAGYTPIPCWGGYGDAPLSRCLEKRLAR